MDLGTGIRIRIKKIRKAEFDPPSREATEGSRRKAEKNSQRLCGEILATFGPLRPTPAYPRHRVPLVWLSAYAVGLSKVAYLAKTLLSSKQPLYWQS